MSLAVPESVIRAASDAVAAADGGGDGGSGGGRTRVAPGGAMGMDAVDAQAPTTKAPIISFFQYHSLLMRYTWRLNDGWMEKARQLKRNMTWPTITTKRGGGGGGGGVSSTLTGTSAFSSKVIAMHVRHGKAVQLEPMKPIMLELPGTKRLKLKYDEPLPKFAFKFKLRRYTKATRARPKRRWPCTGARSYPRSWYGGTGLQYQNSR